jgi:chromosomal replication initiator protein
MDTQKVAESLHDYVERLESILEINNIDYSTKSMDVVSEKYEDFKIQKRLQLSDIMNALCMFYDVESQYIIGKKRDRRYARPRQMLCYIAKNHIPDITLKEIGRYIGNRDHSTVIHSVRSVENEMSYNQKFADEINQIKEMLK